VLYNTINAALRAAKTISESSHLPLRVSVVPFRAHYPAAGAVCVDVDVEMGRRVADNESNLQRSQWALGDARAAFILSAARLLMTTIIHVAICKLCSSRRATNL
jgi:hypothetical protein